MPRPALRTFLFTDLRDYTLFIETRGDEGATKMLRASRRIVRAAVARHRGAEIKTEGDSFYVVFRSPSAALRCAIDIQRANVEHTRAHPDVPVRMGYGINTGEAVPHDNGYVGSAVVIASRLCVAAKPGQILVTDTVRALVRTGAHASMRDLGAWTLKGLAQPIRVYEVDATPAPAHRALGPALPLPPLLVSTSPDTPGLVVCPELVGRDAPLRALAQHLEAAGRGEPRIVAVSGEGGVGKSRLVREIARIAHGQGMFVFGGRSHASSAPYETVIAALRPYAHARGTEILRRLLGPLLAELRRLLPEIDAPGPHAETDLPSDERRERFLRTITLLLEDAAAQRPVLLVLEDFHDADAASRDLLAHLSSTFHGGICVVFTYREDEVGAEHPLRALLAELDRDRRVARVPIAPLDLDGVRRMTAALLPGRETTELARTVFERSEGVPFYVEELLKTALDDPDSATGDLALPQTIADSVRLRISRLVGHRGSGVADMLEVAAVAEVPLGYDALIRLSGRHETESSEDIAAAIDAQLLERPGTKTELYQFRHALTREAVVASIPTARRRRLHARVADAIESLGDPARRASLLARHFAAAGDRTKALSYSRQAAANAIRVGAYPTAIELLRDAAELASGSPDEIDVLEELGETLRSAGRSAEALAVVERAREIALGTGEASTVARLDVLLASVLRIEGRRDEARTVADRAIAALDGTGDEGLGRALVTRAELAWAAQEADRARTLAEQALPIARQRGAARTVIGALKIIGAAKHRLGLDGGAQFAEAIQLGRDRDLPQETADAYFELARAELLRGRDEDALVAARTGLDLARAHGLEFAQAQLLSFLTTLHVNAGHYAEARDAAEQALALARPGTIAHDASKISLANVLITQGDAATAVELLERIPIDRVDPDRRVLLHSYRAQALLALGRLDEAKLDAQEAIDITRSFGLRSITAFLNAVDVAEARRDPGWVRDIAAAYEAHVVDRDTAPIRAIRAEIAGIRAIDDGSDPAPHFERAAAEYGAIGAKGRATYRQASSLIAQLADPLSGLKARRDLEALRSILADWGAGRYVALIDAALARPPWKRPRLTALLSDAELRVALLVARGSTDARIGAELKVSSAAASRQVRALLRKLGVRTRSQLASWAVTRGSVTPSVR